MAHEQEQPSLANEDDDDRAIQMVFRDPAIPHLYVNSVGLIASNSDVCMIVFQNGAATATVNMSFTVAKTIGIALGQIITRLEADTGQQIMTMANVGEKTKQAQTEL